MPVLRGAVRLARVHGVLAEPACLRGRAVCRHVRRPAVSRGGSPQRCRRTPARGRARRDGGGEGLGLLARLDRGRVVHSRFAARAGSARLRPWPSDRRRGRPRARGADSGCASRGTRSRSEVARPRRASSERGRRLRRSAVGVGPDPSGRRCDDHGRHRRRRRGGASASRGGCGPRRHRGPGVVRRLRGACDPSGRDERPSARICTLPPGSVVAGASPSPW